MEDSATSIRRMATSTRRRWERGLFRATDAATAASDNSFSPESGPDELPDPCPESFDFIFLLPASRRKKYKGSPPISPQKAVETVQEKRVFQERAVPSLRALGLTTHEAIVYLALVGRPSSPATDLCNESGIPDSKIYYALNGLLKRGLVSVQNSVPKLYTANDPREAVEALKNELRKSLRKRLSEADWLAESLAPIYDERNEGESLEVAYVVYGFRGIVRRLNGLIASSGERVLAMISEPDVFQGIEEALIEAGKRVRLDIALSGDILKGSDQSWRLRARELHCQCNIVVSDSKYLVTLSDLPKKIALQTIDRSIIEAMYEYFNNSKCCG